MLIPVLTPYEQHLLFCYLTNATSRFRYDSAEAKRLIWWFAVGEDGGGEEEAMLSEWLTDDADRQNRLDKDYDPEGPMELGLSEQDWQDLLKFFEDKRSATKNAPEDTTARRIRHLGNTLGLSPMDMDILNFVLRFETQGIINWMIYCVFDHKARTSTLSYLLDRSAHTILNRFKPDAPLLRSGLISINQDGDVKLMHHLRRLAMDRDDTNLDPTSLLLDAPTPSELEWSDFDHLAQDRDHVEGLLGNALRSGDSGVNILLSGPPETDKTEFCKVLANRLGATLYSIGEADDIKREPGRQKQLNELRLAQRLVGHDRKSLLLFTDSRSDGFWFLLGLSPGHQHGDSKVFMNRLLEQNAAPTLWIMNDTDVIGPGNLCRMTFTMELRTPPPKVRARIWARQLSRHGIEADANDALALATEFDAMPGVAAGVTAAARLGGGGLDTVRHGVRNMSRVIQRNSRLSRS